jgi:hypothetical protein
MDRSSGAAIATLDGLQLLARANFQCRAFCGIKLHPDPRASPPDSRSLHAPLDTRHLPLDAGDTSAHRIF